MCLGVVSFWVLVLFLRVFESWVVGCLFFSQQQNTFLSVAFFLLLLLLLDVYFIHTVFKFFKFTLKIKEITAFHIFVEHYLPSSGLTFTGDFSLNS